MTDSFFWTNVKNRLAQTSMTQLVLAEKVGFSYSLLKKWISTGTIPEAYRVVAIARALGTTAELLIEPASARVQSFLFGDRLREAIVASNQSASDICRLVGVPEEKLESWTLMHDSPLDANQLCKLARQIDVSAEYLCGLTSNTAPDIVVTQKLEQLTKDERNLVLEFAQLIIDRKKK